MTDNRQTVTVRLPRETHAWLRRHAFEQKTSQQRVMEEALDRYRRAIDKESS